MARLSIVLGVFALLAGCGPTVGDPCTIAQECGGALCLNRDFTPGGYCTRSCERAVVGSCPAGTECVRDALGRDADGCMRSCGTQADCRNGYLCRKEKDSAQPICVGPQGI